MTFQILRRCVFLVLMATFLGLLTGCSGGSAPQAVTVPASTEKELFSLVDESRPEVVLTRQGKDFPFQPAKGFRFCVADGVHNSASASILMQSLEEDIRFQLRPGNQVRLEHRSLVILAGSTRMEFRKINGEYKIKLPTSTLGIRGTKLEATVGSDGTTLVKVFEGTISVTDAKGETALKEGEALLLKSDGTSQLNPAEDAVPAFLRDLSRDQVQKAVQKL